ncbi:MAG: hypothetical protein ACRECW_16020 [Phyllobacterium sp.]
MPNYSGAMRRRFAHALCEKYKIPPAEIAPVLGIQEKTLLGGDLKRLGLALTSHETEGAPQPVDELMSLLLSELRAITRPDETVTQKMRLDALGSIARTLERLDEMRARGDLASKAALPLNPAEICAVMQRIDDRIMELAHVRAEELVGKQSGSGAGAID